MVNTGIWEYKGEYFYGPRYYPEMSKREGCIGLYTYLEDKAKRFGFSKEGPIRKAPDGDECPDEWHKSVPLIEVGSLSLPKNYPGDYYWVWYNGAFFKVLGETEKYVLVDIEECGYEQADALGIPREDVACDYHKEQKVGIWWLKKREIKMPDEFGKGKFIYIYMLNTYLPGEILEVIKKEGSVVRLRHGEIYNVESMFEEIKESIRDRAFPWYVRNEIQVKEIAENAEAECWKEGDYVYFEFNIDMEIMKRWRAKLAKEITEDTKSEIKMHYYWYGKEVVPYRL